MFIASMTIENVRAIADPLRLDFRSSEHLVRRRSILLGPNGCGKTTTLRAIAHFFSTFDTDGSMNAAPLNAADVHQRQRRVEAGDDEAENDPGPPLGKLNFELIATDAEIGRMH